MRTLKILVIAVAIAMLAVPAMAAPIPLTNASCPVNLKIMPVATVVAPQAINVAITTITAAPGPIPPAGTQMGSSSGLDYGTFLIGTNLLSVQLDATIGNPGLTGGTWDCHLQGNPFPGTGADTGTYPGPIPDGTPFNVFVQVTNVNMTTVAWNPNFIFDTLLTLTMSIP